MLRFVLDFLSTPNFFLARPKMSVNILAPTLFLLAILPQAEAYYAEVSLGFWVVAGLGITQVFCHFKLLFQFCLLRAVHYTRRDRMLHGWLLRVVEQE